MSISVRSYLLIYFIKEGPACSLRAIYERRPKAVKVHFLAKFAAKSLFRINLWEHQF